MAEDIRNKKILDEKKVTIGTIFPGDKPEINKLNEGYYRKLASLKKSRNL